MRLIEKLKGYENKYVLNPRVANEMILPHRAFFNDVLTEAQKESWSKDVNSLISWINENLEIDEVHNPQNLRMLPGGVWDSRKTDAFSRNIFFVSICRSLGMPARIDPVTSKVQYMNKVLAWEDVSFGEKVKNEQINAGGKGIAKVYALCWRIAHKVWIENVGRCIHPVWS